MSKQSLNQKTSFRKKYLHIAVSLAIAGLASQAPITDRLAHAQTPPEDDAVVVLPGIVVEGEPGVVTEDTGSYTTERATVGAKHPVDIKDVPQTVNVITQQRLEDGDARSIEEAAYLIPNITTTTGDGFSGSLYSRGHEVFTYNVDGAPRPYLSIYGTAPDMIFFDRVEVLSGPSGVFQGSGEPVGTLNLVRKRAQDTFGAKGAVSYGSYDSKRIEADVTGAFTDDGSVRGRIIGYGLEEDSFVDVTGQERSGGYGTLEVDAGDATTVSLGGIVEQQDVIRWSGLPTYTNGDLIDFDRDTFIGAPWGDADTTTTEGFVEVEHELDNGSVLKVAGRQYDREADIKSPLATSAVDPVTGDFSMIAFARHFEETTQYVDLNYTTPFDWLGHRSEFTLGTDYRNTDQTMLQKFASLGTQNIYTFDPDDLIEPDIDYDTPGPGRASTDTETEEFGAYGYARLSLTERVKVTLGTRYANYDSDTLNKLTDETTTISEERFVPFAGVGYDFTPATTGYVSYSEIFQPQSEQEVDGSQLDPIVGKQVEVGVKTSIGRLDAQAAVYWLKDENRAVDDPDNPGFYLANGEAETKGFEANIGGRLTPNLDVTAGYAYVDTELDTDPTSAHNFTAWGKYSFTEGRMRDWYAGAGLRAASEFDAMSGDIRIEAPGYTVFDALIGYHITPRVNAQLFVNNVFDENYVERVNQVSRGTFYGEPLSANFRLSATF